MQQATSVVTVSLEAVVLHMSSVKTRFLQRILMQQATSVVTVLFFGKQTCYKHTTTTITTTSGKLSCNRQCL